MIRRKIQQLKNGTYIISLPKEFLAVFRWKKGDTCEWHCQISTDPQMVNVMGWLELKKK